MFFATACGGAAPSVGSTAPAKSASQPASLAPQAAAASAKMTKMNLLLNFIPSANQLPFFLGVARGYYKAAGIDLNVIDGKSTTLTVQAVANGQAQVGWASLDVMALARAKGAPLVAVMGGMQRQVFGVFVGKHSGITSFKDLVGRSLLLVPGSPSAFYLPAVAKMEGFNASRVKLIYVAPNSIITDYLTKKAPAMTTDAAWANSFVQPKRPSRVLYFADAGVTSPSFGLFVRQDYLKSHAALMRRFLAATVQSWQAMLTDPQAPAEATQDIIKAHPIMHLAPAPFLADWQIYRKFINTPNTEGHPFGWESSKDWTAALHMLQQDAGLKGSMKPSTYYTNAYLPSHRAS